MSLMNAQLRIDIWYWMYHVPLLLLKITFSPLWDHCACPSRYLVFYEPWLMGLLYFPKAECCCCRKCVIHGDARAIKFHSLLVHDWAAFKAGISFPINCNQVNFRQVMDAHRSSCCYEHDEPRKLFSLEAWLFSLCYPSCLNSSTCLLCHFDHFLSRMSLVFYPWGYPSPRHDVYTVFSSLPSKYLNEGKWSCWECRSQGLQIPFERARRVLTTDTHCSRSIHVRKEWIQSWVHRKEPEALTRGNW